MLLWKSCYTRKDNLCQCEKHAVFPTFLRFVLNSEKIVIATMDFWFQIICLSFKYFILIGTWYFSDHADGLGWKCCSFWELYRPCWCFGWWQLQYQRFSSTKSIKSWWLCPKCVRKCGPSTSGFIGQQTIWNWWVSFEFYIDLFQWLHCGCQLSSKCWF